MEARDDRIALTNQGFFGRGTEAYIVKNDYREEYMIFFKKASIFYFL